MKRLLSLVTVVAAVLCIIITSTVTYHAETSLTLDGIGRVILIQGDSEGGFYILSELDNNYVITHLYTDNSSDRYEININCDDSAFTYSNNKFYFAQCYSEDTGSSVVHYTAVTIYDCIEEAAVKRTINDLYFEYSRGIGADSRGNIYFPQATNIEVYSHKGKFLESYEAYSNTLNTSTSPNGECIFFVMFDRVSVICNSEISILDISADSILTLENGYFETDTGEVYNYNGSSLEYIQNFDSDTIGVGTVEDYLIGTLEGNLKAVSDSEILEYFSVSTPDFLVSSNGRCACFTQKEKNLRIDFINLTNFKRTNTDIENNSEINTDSRDLYFYKSSKYIFDDNKFIIYGIEPSSTVAVIKNNIEYSGYDIKFNDYNEKHKTSGTVGTGGKLIFDGHSDKKAYTIVIYGDLTGEGNINSIDKKKLFDHLLEKEHLTGHYAEAADIDRNGLTDLKDLAAINKYLNNGYEIEQIK